MGILGGGVLLRLCGHAGQCITAEPSLQVIPEVILKVFPYVVTLLALIFFSKTTQAPRAAGEPFEKGKR